MKIIEDNYTNKHGLTLQQTVRCIYCGSVLEITDSDLSADMQTTNMQKYYICPLCGARNNINSFTYFFR